MVTFVSRDRAVDPGVLGVALDGLVPLWALKVQAWTPEKLAAERDATAWAIACGGDALFSAIAGPSRSDMRLPTPDALTAEQMKDGGVARSYGRGEILGVLAKAIAMGSLLPGGVTLLGRHWCTAPHPGCHRGAAGGAA